MLDLDVVSIVASSFGILIPIIGNYIARRVKKTKKTSITVNTKDGKVKLEGYSEKEVRDLLQSIIDKTE